MARRNIAKTAIEGGRSHWCRFAEEQADAKERMMYRKYCRLAILDPEVAEPKESTGRGWFLGRKYREFSDKLSPVKRWLEARVGQPWNKVFSEVCRTFNNRTVAGRHVVGHVRDYVTLPEDPALYNRWSSKSRWFPGQLYVDKKGILRQKPYND